MSPYELQVGAINGMAKFYSWRGIMKKLLKGDLYYTAIRYWGKKMIREWWKDEDNRAYVDWLRAQLYADAEHGPSPQRTVGYRPCCCKTQLGQLLHRFLGELGVTVVPLAEARPRPRSRARRPRPATPSTASSRRSSSARSKEREEFYAISPR